MPFWLYHRKFWVRTNVPRGAGLPNRKQQQQSATGPRAHNMHAVTWRFTRVNKLQGQLLRVETGIYSLFAMHVRVIWKNKGGAALWACSHTLCFDLFKWLKGRMTWCAKQSNTKQRILDLKWKAVFQKVFRCFCNVMHWFEYIQYAMAI